MSLIKESNNSEFEPMHGTPSESKEPSSIAPSTIASSAIAPNLADSSAMALGHRFVNHFLPRQVNRVRRLSATPRGKKVIAGSIALLILLVSVSIVQERVHSLVSDAEVDIISIRILSSGPDSLELELDLLIENPVAIGVETDESDLKLNYHGIHTADLEIGSMDLDPGENTITVDATLTEHDPGMMQAMAEYLLNQGDVDVQISGEVSLGGWMPFSLPVDRVITLEKFTGPNITLSRVAITDSGSSSQEITGEVGAIVNSSSTIESTLAGLTFSVTHPSGYLAELTASGILSNGENELTLGLTIPSSASDVAKEIVTDLMSGAGLGGGVVIQGNGRSDSLLSRLTSTYQYTYFDNGTVDASPTNDTLSASGVGSIGDIGIAIENISILETDEAGMHGEITATLSNPSILEVALDGLQFGISYNDSHLAELTSFGYLSQGNSTITLSLFIPAHASMAYNTLAGDMLDGGNYTFNLTGTEIPGIPLTSIVSAFSYTYELNVSEHISVEVGELAVSPGLFTTIIDATAHIMNPTPVTMNLAPFQLTAYYQGNHLGDIALSYPWIIPGNQTIDITMTVSTLRLQNIGLLAKLLIGSPIELVIEAKHVFDPENVFSVTITTTIGETVPSVRGPSTVPVVAPPIPSIPLSIPPPGFPSSTKNQCFKYCP